MSDSSSTIIEELSDWCLRTENVLAYWYFDFNDTSRQTVENWLRCVIRQLAAVEEAIPQALIDLASEFRAAGKQPTVQKLTLTLNAILENLQRDVFLVMDALDECPERAGHVKRRDLLTYLTQLHSRGHRNLHILATSRAEIDIQRNLENIATQNMRIEELFHNDIRLLVQNRLGEGKLARWSREVKGEIEMRLMHVEEP